MEYRYMGRTGLQLSVLSLGSWVTFAKQVDDFRSDQLMSLAYESGVNFFDNAEGYANGESEMMMGRVLRNKDWDRTSYVLSSKVFFGINGKDNRPNQQGLSRKHIMEACHQALERLQTDYLDLYFCHRPDPQVPVEEIVRTMNTLISQGKILYWGTSEWSGAELLAANEAAESLGLEGPKMEQPQYNIIERYKVESDYLPVYERYGLGTTIWSPLASGLLTGKYNEGIPEDSRLAMDGMEWLKEKIYNEDNLSRIRQLGAIARELGVSQSALSIAWCLKNPHVTSAILGASRLEQLEDNLTAMQALEKMDDGVMAAIRGVIG